MTLRTLLVPITDKTGLDALLKTAFGAATRFGSHVTGLFVRPDPRSAIPFVGEAMTADVIQDLCDAAEREGRARADAAQALFHQLAGEHGLAPGDGGVSGAGASWEEAVGMIADKVGRAARLADLTVVAQPGETGEAQDGQVFNDVLFRSGRPLLMAPASASGFADRRVLVAWNGRAECARTVAAALPVLADADDVIIMTVGEEHPERPSLAALKGYLARHGIAATAEHRDAADRSVGEAVLAAVDEAAADLLVMGAYSHSRWREMIIGGVTRHAVQKTSVPIFMSH